MISITVNNQAVITGLKAMKGKTFNKSKAAIKAGALVITNEAKELVPVLSGNLKRSIHDEPVTTTPGKISAQIGTNVKYGPAIEFGHSRRAPGGYLRPALDTKGDKAVKEIEDSLKVLF